MLSGVQYNTVVENLGSVATMPGFELRLCQLTSCVTLDKSLDISVLWFSHL